MITPKLVDIYEKDIEVLKGTAKYGMKDCAYRAQLQIDILEMVIKDLKSLESYILWMEQYKIELAEQAKKDAEFQDKYNEQRATKHQRGFSKFS